MIDKEQVRRRFRSALTTYEGEAAVQERVAARLLGLLAAEKSGWQPVRVLEIGSSTGLLTGALVRQYPAIQELYVNDLVADFEPLVREKAASPDRSLVFLAGDIESLPLPGAFDLIISSSTFHWLHDLAGFFGKLRSHLRPGGVLAFSLYGPRNLQEIRAVSNIGLVYHDLGTLKKMVSVHFTLHVCDEEPERFVFPDPLAVLNHLRATGVNAVQRSAWSRRQLRDFCRNYQESFSCPGGVTLTYHPMYCIAE